jgi:hypothetical protein
MRHPATRDVRRSATVTGVRFIREFRRLGALRLSILSTVLIYLIIPAGVITLVAALVLASGRSEKPDRRYRPGRPYTFQPIWFLASPEQVIGHDQPAVAGRGNGQAALTGPVLEDSSGARIKAGPTGGASDSW